MSINEVMLLDWVFTEKQLVVHLNSFYLLSFFTLKQIQGTWFSHEEGNILDMHA